MKLLVMFIIFILWVGGRASFATEFKTRFIKDLDTELLKKLSLHKIIALKKKIYSPEELAVARFGKMLFEDQDLSGNRNRSCLSCHHPDLGTSDGEFFSRAQSMDKFVPRNAQSLFNVLHAQDRVYFHDGRVQFNSSKHRFRLPLKELNGDDPLQLVEVEKLWGGLSAQVLFPLLSRDEMRGELGENELANESDDFLALSKIADRVRAKPAAYASKFKQAFPSENWNQLHFTHIANAISKFIEVEFEAVDTGFNRYLQGDLEALSLSEKNGLNIFLTKARCVVCHSGSYLGNDGRFFNVGVPELSFIQVDSGQLKKRSRDYGLYQTTKFELDKFHFKTPSLLNVSLSPPYFHNGSMVNLEKVVEHYNDVMTSIDQYVVPEKYKKRSPVELFVYNETKHRDELKNKLSFQMLKQGLNLTLEEKNNLLQFLKISLTEKKYLKKGVVR